jgi:hypothetical protein
LPFTDDSIARSSSGLTRTRKVQFLASPFGSGGLPWYKIREMKPALIAAAALAAVVGLAPRCKAEKQRAHIENTSYAQYAFVALTEIPHEAKGDGDDQPGKNDSPDGNATAQWVLIGITGITAGFICWQAWETRKAAKAAATAAQATLQSAEGLVNSERAWITVDVEWTENPGKVLEGNIGGIETTSVFVRLTCTNQGKTPAWVERRSIALAILDSWDSFKHQGFDIKSLEPMMIDFDVLAAGKNTSHTGTLDCEGRIRPQNVALIYGNVNYRDIFGRDRHTTFGYEIVNRKKLMRIPWAPKYNEHT